MDNLKNKGKKAKHRFVIESVIIFFIIITPFLFKSHEYLPTDPEATISILGFEIGRNGFNDVNTYVWFMLGKIIPLYLLLIWFLTNKHWWYHILLIPICMYAFQIFEVLYSKDQYIDTENVLWILPICMIVIPFVYFIRIRLYDKHVHGIDLEAMDAELQYYRNKENEQLRKHGITPPTSYMKKEEQTKVMDGEVEDDLSQQLPKTIISKFIKQLKASIFSMF